MKAASLITLNIDEAPIASKSYTHPSTLTNLSSINLVLYLGVPVPLGTQCIRDV
jgi:hypothetical protein